MDIYIIKNLGYCYFFFLVTISIFFFIFYHTAKYQIFFFPLYDLNSDIYNGFEIILYFLCVIFFIILIQNLREISSTETILLDWERKEIEIDYPKNILQNENMLQNENYQNDEINLDTQKNKLNLQSAWRSILIANEFYELSTKRNISIELLFILYILFLKKLNYEKTISEYNNIFYGENQVLQFGLNSILLLGIGFVLYIIKKIYDNFFGSSIENFLDLLSLSNISILIFDSNIHGFYLHGNNNMGSSEGELEDFQKMLKKEEKGFLGKRGLIEKSELQTFEVYLPSDFRKFLDTVYNSEIKNEIAEKLNYNYFNNNQTYGNDQSQNYFNNDNSGYNKNSNYIFQNQKNFNFNQNPSNKKRKKNEALPLNLNFDKIFEKKKIITNAFKKILEKINRNKENCLEKTLFHKILNYPGIDLKLINGSPVFFKDKEKNFKKTLFLGNEFINFLAIVVIFLTIDFWTNNGVLTCFIVFIIDLVRSFIMAYFIKKNFSRSSLVNEAFLE